MGLRQSPMLAYGIKTSNRYDNTNPREAFSSTAGGLF